MKKSLKQLKFWANQRKSHQFKSTLGGDTVSSEIMHEDMKIFKKNHDLSPFMDVITQLKFWGN